MTAYARLTKNHRTTRHGLIRKGAWGRVVRTVGGRTDLAVTTSLGDTVTISVPAAKLEPMKGNPLGGKHTKKNPLVSAPRLSDYSGKHDEWWLARFLIALFDGNMTRRQIMDRLKVVNPSMYKECRQEDFDEDYVREWAIEWLQNDVFSGISYNTVLDIATGYPLGRGQKATPGVVDGRISRELGAGRGTTKASFRDNPRKRRHPEEQMSAEELRREADAADANAMNEEDEWARRRMLDHAGWLRGLADKKSRRKRKTKRNPHCPALTGLGTLVNLEIIQPGGRSAKTLRTPGRWLAWDGQAFHICRIAGGTRPLTDSATIRRHRQFHGQPPAGGRVVDRPAPVGALRQIGLLKALTYRVPSHVRSPEKNPYLWHHAFGDTGHKGGDHYPEKVMPALMRDANGNLFIKRRPGNIFRVDQWLRG